MVKGVREKLADGEPATTLRVTLACNPTTLKSTCRPHPTLASAGLTACLLGMSSVHHLVRDCTSTLIPAGDVVVLEKGTEVTVTQALGGSVTVRTPMGLFRIAPADIEALGAEAVSQYGKKDEAVISGPVNQEALWEALKGCFDPEIPVNIVDLGLIYHLELTPGERGGQKVAAKMTLTAQGCGMGPVIAADAKSKMEALPGVESAEVEIVWDPVWNPRMISEAGRKQLGLE